MAQPSPPLLPIQLCSRHFPWLPSWDLELQPVLMLPLHGILVLNLQPLGLLAFREELVKEFSWL